MPFELYFTLFIWGSLAEEGGGGDWRLDWWLYVCMCVRGGKGCQA